MSAVLLVIMGSALWAGTPFDEALLAQQEGRYADAAAAYERLVREGSARAELFHNLGLAYAALGRMGEAAVQWKRALAADPSLRPAKFNLDRCLDGLDAAASHRGVSGEWMEALRRTAWRWGGLLRAAALAAWAVGWAGVAAGIRRPQRSWWVLGGAMAALGLLLLGVDGFAHGPGKEALVIVEEAHAHYGASAEEPVAFTLGEGESVHLETDGKEWVRIRTGRGERGWVEAENLLRVGPPFDFRRTDGP